MNVAILQPVFIPNLHDLAVLCETDLIILQDTETWSRKGRVHRALIRTPEGTQYINIPVLTEDRDKPIRDVRIDHEQNWIEPILRKLKFNYRNSVYYDFYEPEIRADFEAGRKFRFLLPFVNHFRSRIYQFLELENLPPTKLASSMENYHPDPDILSEQLDASRYFQEPGSRRYQRQGNNKSEIDFEHPVYRQHFDGFEPYCCLLDLLFQYGPESFRIIDQICD